MPLETISFDCADKTLGYVHARVDFSDFFNKLRGLLRIKITKETLEQYEKQLNACLLAFNDSIKIIKRGVADLHPGDKIKSVDSIKRAKKLKEFLDAELSVDVAKKCDAVVIERQPDVLFRGKFKVANSKSTKVEAQLCMYYVDCNIVLQEAALKNRISLSNKLVFSGGGQQACKDHSKKSMIYMTEILSNENMLHGIKKAVYDDLADAFMHMLYFSMNKLGMELKEEIKNTLIEYRKD